MSKDVKEIKRLRTEAAKYANKFLRQKYYTEYQELYDAYLINRGLNIRRQPAPLIDERKVKNV